MFVDTERNTVEPPAFDEVGLMQEDGSMRAEFAMVVTDPDDAGVTEESSWIDGALGMSASARRRVDGDDDFDDDDDEDDDDDLDDEPDDDVDDDEVDDDLDDDLDFDSDAADDDV